jgi:hypothetical protein
MIAASGGVGLVHCASSYSVTVLSLDGVLDPALVLAVLLGRERRKRATPIPIRWFRARRVGKRWPGRWRLAWRGSR